jgi:hypothetical protein
MGGRGRIGRGVPRRSLERLLAHKPTRAGGRARGKPGLVSWGVRTIDGRVKVVLITGAGASTKLGRDSDLPMMPGLSRVLYEALNAKQPHLADAILLEKDMNGPDFEEALGLLFRWRDGRKLNERFSSLGFAQLKGAQMRGSDQQQRWAAEEEHLKTALRVIDETLFSVFGSDEIEPSKAKSAYQWLFEQMGGLQEFDLMCATTNYDPSLEMALRMLDIDPDLGFRGEEWETKSLNADAIEPWKRTALLHLHGAVGWYRRGDGEVIPHGKNERLNESLGRPAILYPDPDKDPAEGATRDLWQVLRNTMNDASHLLVLGHSLHDPPLVQLVRTADADLDTRVGVVVRSARKGKGNHFEVLDTQLEELVGQQLPNATVIRGSFDAPEPAIARTDLKKWVG